MSDKNVSVNTDLAHSRVVAIPKDMMEKLFREIELEDTSSDLPSAKIFANKEFGEYINAIFDAGLADEFSTESTVFNILANNVLARSYSLHYTVIASEGRQPITNCINREINNLQFI